MHGMYGRRAPRPTNRRGGPAAPAVRRRPLSLRAPEAVRTLRPRGVGMSMSSPKGSSASARLAEMPPRKLARITGLLWIATFITSIPALLLYDQVLNNKHFILGGGSSTPIFIGATLELLLIIACIGTTVLPYALFKRYNEKL